MGGDDLGHDVPAESRPDLHQVRVLPHLQGGAVRREARAEPGGQPGRQAAPQGGGPHQHHAGPDGPDVVLHAVRVYIRPEITQLRIVVYGSLRHAVMPQLLRRFRDSAAHQHRLHPEPHRLRQLPGLADQLQAHRMQPPAADLRENQDILPLTLIHAFHPGFQPDDRPAGAVLHADPADPAGFVDIRLPFLHGDRPEGAALGAPAASGALSLQQRNLRHPLPLLR